MKLFTVLLWVLTIGLQYQLWLGRHGVKQLIITREVIAAQKNNNNAMLARNKHLSSHVIRLQNNLIDEAEVHAREDLGMIHKNETFYFIRENKG